MAALKSNANRPTIEFWFDNDRLEAALEWSRSRTQ